MDYPHASVNTNQLAVKIKTQQFPYLESVRLLMAKSSKVAYRLQGIVSNLNKWLCVKNTGIKNPLWFKKAENVDLGWQSLNMTQTLLILSHEIVIF